MQRQVRDDYAASVEQYIEFCGTIDAADPADRELVAGWAASVDGPILDVGCGPGQWTAFLCGRGAQVAGVDPVGEFVDAARIAYPDVDYRVGHAGALECASSSQAGVLAWFSLIHADPGEMDVALADLARVLRPGGRLLVGYFEGPQLERFDHKVTPAWRWPVDRLAGRLERAGFVVTDHVVRIDAAVGREVGAISAELRRGRPRTR